MKQLHTLNAGESIQFNAGQAGKYLIIREASHSLMLRGDALRPTEIGRGDTVDITRFDELELFNHQEESVTVEYQVADIPISTKSQNIDINNSVAISEILTPITVSKVQESIKVSEVSSPVNIAQIQAPVNVRRVVEPVTVEQITQPLTVERIQQPVNVEVGNASLDVQATITNTELKVTLDPERVTFAKIGNGTLSLTGRTQTIRSKTARKALILQAAATNKASVMVQGFLELRPGGHLMLNTNQAVTLKGAPNDVVRLGEAL